MGKLFNHISQRDFPRVGKAVNAGMPFVRRGLFRVAAHSLLCDEWRRSGWASNEKGPKEDPGNYETGKYHSFFTGIFIKHDVAAGGQPGFFQQASEKREMTANPAGGKFLLLEIEVKDKAAG
ncbi:hypothetical protein KM043_015804 [Ampulex compressa]|nr:hypothetical protein KM043_015804 [Ampulex compressa]